MTNPSDFEQELDKLIILPVDAPADTPVLFRKNGFVHKGKEMYSLANQNTIDKLLGAHLAAVDEAMRAARVDELESFSKMAAEHHDYLLPRSVILSRLAELDK